ncbi:MAG: hypothetical protein EOM91_11545 [Sphingobacteriia bacterium]|nr:hypothetical protein [Sphingobacteriia bacterium]NCC38346.1 hypothetical protein [Gammaproteobacteria bacterium]
MSTTDQPSLTQPDTHSGGFWRLVLAEWPYILLFIAVIAGIAITDLKLEFALLYWQILIPIFGILALVIGWPDAGEDASTRLRFALKTFFHWAALFGLILILYYPPVAETLSSEATGMHIIFLLGLTAVLSGIHGKLEMAVVGLFVIGSGIMIAFIEDAAVMMSIVALAVVIVSIIVHKLLASRTAD